MRRGRGTTTTTVLAATLWLAALALGGVAVAQDPASTNRMPLVLADIWLLVCASADTVYLALRRCAERYRRAYFEYGYLAAYSDLGHQPPRRGVSVPTQTRTH